MTRTNAKKELLDHVGDNTVFYIAVTLGYYEDERKCFYGTFDEVVPLLDFEYDSGYGGQELYGNIWYTDGTWSERGEYDGSEWWEHKICPPIPNLPEDCNGRY